MTASSIVVGKVEIEEELSRLSSSFKPRPRSREKSMVARPNGGNIDVSVGRMLPKIEDPDDRKGGWFGCGSCVR